MLSFEQQLSASTRRLTEAALRIRTLSAAEKNLNTQEALAFNLERAAWALLEQAQAWVYERRLGIPRKETENLDLLYAQGWLAQDTARRFKQFAEYRSLSARESGRTDWDSIQGGLAAELELLEQWAALNRQWELTCRS
jgi:uncharacterized protein YutE (UPF0331/DUF86 family)